MKKFPTASSLRKGWIDDHRRDRLSRFVARDLIPHEVITQQGAKGEKKADLLGNRCRFVIDV